MSEEQKELTDALEMIGAGYDSDQPAAIIDPPRNVRALRDNGMIEYKAWGWVKMSAKFIAHLKFLKGAKLAIWQCVALSIDETGTCKITLKDIGILTGYSHTEIIASLAELEAGGYMTINRNGKTNIYQPVFVARGEEKPKETLVKKLDSTPEYQYESSLALENSVPSIKRVKRVNTGDIKEIEKQANKKMDAYLDMMANSPGIKREARINDILSYLGVTFRRNTETREWLTFAKYIDSELQTKGWDVKQFVSWLFGQKDYNPNYWPVKKMMEFYPSAFVKEDKPESPIYKPYIPEDEAKFVPAPTRLKL